LHCAARSRTHHDADIEYAQLDKNTSYAHGLDGTNYLPGVVGLNNIKTTDWVNVSVQALIRVPTLRNFFLAEKNYASVRGWLLHACPGL
jgi:U4/U6.U5 tri-snRNP-associated protein 2